MVRIHSSPPKQPKVGENLDYQQNNTSLGIPNIMSPAAKSASGGKQVIKHQNCQHQDIGDEFHG